MKNEIKKTAIVTGASRGIGLAVARQLGLDGYNVVMVATGCREKNSEAIAHLEGLGIAVGYVQADVSDHDDRLRIVGQTVEMFGRIDVLVNNAGFGKLGEFTQVPLDDELRMIDTNITALHILTKLFLKDFVKADRGYILNVASSAGLLPGGPLMATYYATKAYVTSLTSAIYGELKQQGSSVSISALCPGPVDTEFNSVANAVFPIEGIDAKQCADIAVRGMFSKELIIIPETRMKLAAAASGIVPRKLAVAVTGQLQSAKKQ